jgi:antitoxin component YwqK of YwqJK toxin-antitoxin module
MPLSKWKEKWFISCIAKLYRNKKDQLEKEYNFINDKKEGLYKRWNNNEKIKCQCNFINGKREGLYLV